MNADPLVRAGQRVGKYILGNPIARGGMAEVWAARVEGPRGFVKSLALKFILDSFAGDSDLERLFVNEARLAAQLQHANLVSVFDFDKISDGRGPARYYIAMERIEGHDLRRVLQNLVKRGRRLPPEIALHMAGEVLKGLRYVHERRDPDTLRALGLVHRDVSPHNILIGMGGEVKLSDFGIAKAMSQSLGTKAGMIRGKLAYASPEQLRSETFDHRTDQFALGVTLWEALAGQRLFDGPSEMDIINKVLRCHIPPLPADVGLAPATEAVVRHMLAAQPDGRYASTAEAFSALLACPGYTPDGGALQALMQEVFAPQNLELPPTLPLDAAAVLPAGPGQQVSAEIVAFPGNTTPAVEQPAVPWEARARGDGIPEPRTAEGGVPDSTTVAESERSVTGSAYVSTAEGVPPLARTRPAPRAAALGVASIVSLALVAVVLTRAWHEAPSRPVSAVSPPSASPPRPVGVAAFAQPSPQPVSPAESEPDNDEGPGATPPADSAPADVGQAEQPRLLPERPAPGGGHAKRPRGPSHVPKAPAVLALVPPSAPASRPPERNEPATQGERNDSIDEPSRTKAIPSSPDIAANGAPVLP